MNKRISTGMSLLIAALVVLAGISCSKENAAMKSRAEKKPAGHEEMLEQYLKNMEELKKVVVARVNGEAITKYDLFSRANKLASSYAQGGQKMTPEIEAKVQKQALDELIFKELAIQEAIRRKMNVPQQDVDEMLKQYKAKIGTEKEYVEHLKRKNLTEASVRKMIERELLFRMITSKEVSEKVKKEGAGKDQALEKRKKEWEAELKKNAKIDIALNTGTKSSS